MSAVDHLIRLARMRVYVPPHTRATKSGTVNVDGYWRTITSVSDLTGDEKGAIFERSGMGKLPRDVQRAMPVKVQMQRAIDAVRRQRRSEEVAHGIPAGEGEKFGSTLGRRKAAITDIDTSRRLMRAQAARDAGFQGPDVRHYPSPTSAQMEQREWDFTVDKIRAEGGEVYVNGTDTWSVISDTRGWDITREKGVAWFVTGDGFDHEEFSDRGSALRAVRNEMKKGKHFTPPKSQTPSVQKLIDRFGMQRFP